MGGLRKGAVTVAEERLGVGEDDGRGDGGGVVAAEGGGRAAGGPVQGSIACAPGLRKAMEVRDGGARLQGERTCRLDQESVSSGQCGAVASPPL